MLGARKEPSGVPWPKDWVRRWHLVLEIIGGLFFRPGGFSQMLLSGSLVFCPLGGLQPSLDPMASPAAKGGGGKEGLQR